MRPLILIVTLLLFTPLAQADEGWTLRADGPGLHTLEIDSTRTKCTIVEFSDRIYLIEVALSSQGGGARELKENREGGEALIARLEAEFPGKPLAAVVHSHWHPHSIASVAPFLERDIPLVTTRANFERVQEFIEPDLLEAKNDLIRFVEEDHLTLGEGEERIVARRLLKDDYPTLPTPDYLFVEIPARRALFTGCMYSIYRDEPVAGREVIPSRAIDVHAYLENADFEVDDLVRVYMDGEEPTDSELIPATRLYETIATGITVTELGERFTTLSADELRTQRDRLVREAVADHVPPRILNRLVYDQFETRDLDKALELAVLQALLNPSNANAWDTLGEVYYFMGEVEVARSYEKQSRAIDPEFTSGGEEVWAEGLADFQKRWAEMDSGS